jgi:hypothetical protein
LAALIADLMHAMHGSPENHLRSRLGGSFDCHFFGQHRCAAAVTVLQLQPAAAARVMAAQ